MSYEGMSAEVYAAPGNSPKLPGMGMTEVRAASGVFCGSPGTWWSREITPEGEGRDSETAVSRNWLHAIGGGPIHKGVVAWSHPICAPTDYPNGMHPMGTIDDPRRRIRTAVEEATGSRMAGESVACAATFVVPEMSGNPFVWLVPLGIGAAVYWWQRKRGKQRGAAIGYGVATWAILPLAFCYLGLRYPMGSW